MFFFVLTAAGFSGCSSSGSKSSGIVTISGTATDDPLENASISIMDMDGNLLASGQTDAKGFYSIEVKETDIQDGYELSVKGGEINGTAFTGELRAFYGLSDNRSTANVTLLTTLVAGFLENSNGNTTLEKRDNAVIQLAEIGMCKTENWNATEPELVDLSALRLFISEKGLDSWVSEICEDLKDSDLSPAMMKGFPYAHGGILSISTATGSNRFSVLPGDSFDGTITVTASDNTAGFTYKIITAPDGMTIDTQGHMNCILSADTAEGNEIPVEIRATNTQTGFSRVFKAVVSVQTLSDVDNDNDGYTETQGDCNDADNTVYPGATETCGDGIDQDCNGSDLGCSGVDNDADGFSESLGDCNDADNTVYPGATEICGDGIDQDCDGSDTACAKTWYKDIDKDGYSDGTTEEAVDQPENYYAADSLSAVSGDCNDENAEIHPGAEEICGDGIDQDCNGADTVCQKRLWYKDADGDGYSDGTTTESLEQPEDYYSESDLKAISGDCDDNNKSVNPGATDICDNGIDEDCSGSDSICYTPPSNPEPSTPTLQSVSISPSDYFIPLGKTHQYTAIASYSNGSTQDVTSQGTWNFPDLSIADVDNSGLVESLGLGSENISFTYSGINASVKLTVTDPALNSLKIFPINPAGALEIDTQLSAIGTYSDNSEIDLSGQVTWSSSDDSVAAVDNTGLVNSLVDQGETTITAKIDQVSATEMFTVAAPYTLNDGNTVILGPLENAAVSVYRLSNLNQPLDTSQTGDKGVFELSLNADIQNSELLLITASGGQDIDFNDDGFDIEAPVENKGSVHALVTAGEIRAKKVIVSAVSEMAWQFTKNMLEDTHPEDILIRLGDIANVLFKERLEADTEIYQDLNRFNPILGEHKAKLNFDYRHLTKDDALLDAIHQGLEQSIIQERITLITSNSLSFFSAKDSRSQYAKIQLLPFGKGKVSASSGKLYYDSENAANDVLKEFYTIGETITLEAEPHADTLIQSWRGCDEVSEDNTTCTLTVREDTIIAPTFVYEETIVSDNIVDFSNARTTISGETYMIQADPADEETIDRLENLTAGNYIVSSQEPVFVREVTSVSRESQQSWIYRVETTGVEIEKLIQQGSVVAQKRFTHNDLVSDDSSTST